MFNLVYISSQWVYLARNDNKLASSRQDFVRGIIKGNTPHSGLPQKKFSLFDLEGIKCFTSHPFFSIAFFNKPTVTSTGTILPSLM